MSSDQQRFRVVVDTNVLIRGLLSSTGASALLLDAIRRRRCLLITSRAHLSELHRVLSRPRFARRYGVSARRRRRLIARLYTLAAYVRPSGTLAICRDPHDDYLIEMALLARATHLVSEDDDLHDDLDIIELLRQSDVQLVRASALARVLVPAE